MYVVPKIVNNEKVQELPSQFIDLAADWMKELKPETLLDKNKGE